MCDEILFHLLKIIEEVKSCLFMRMKFVNFAPSWQYSILVYTLLHVPDPQSPFSGSTFKYQLSTCNRSNKYLYHSIPHPTSNNKLLAIGCRPYIIESFCIVGRPLSRIHQMSRSITWLVTWCSVGLLIFSAISQREIGEKSLKCEPGLYC